jgi:TolB protein
VFASTREGGQSIYLLNLRNNNVQRITQGQLDGTPAFSVDGGRIAYTSNTGDNNEVFVLDLSSNETERITNNPGDDAQPAWLPVFIDGS